MKRKVGVLATGLLAMLFASTVAVSQQATGSLFFANRVSGAYAAGYFDRYGDFHQTWLPGSTLFKAITSAISTPNGILVYNSSTGVGIVVQVKDDGTTSTLTYLFSPGWDNIVSVGDYLFFYKLDGTAAVGQITADGAFTAGMSYAAGSVPRYTSVIATANNVFLYNSADGSAATAYVYKGAFVYSQALLAGSVPTGYTYGLGLGNYVLLYNQLTGSTLIGVIDGRPGTFQSRATATLPAGYSKLVKHGRYALLYNPATGASTIGYVDRVSAAKFVITQQPAFSTAWTSIVSTNDDLLFYNSGTGAGAAGRIDDTGKFSQTPQSLPFSAGWSTVAATSR